MGKLFPLLRSFGPVLPETIDLAGRAVPVEVTERANARRIVMRLAPSGGTLRLTVPRRTSARVIRDFLDRHKAWAEVRLAALVPAPRIADGAAIPFRGQPLRLVHDPARRGACFEIVDGQTRLRVGGDPAHFSRRVRDVLQREARTDLDAAVSRHSARVGVAVAAMSLKDTRSRWGSCSAARRLAFSWRIVMAPPAVLDYLAAHEVAHLREMNHGPAFWALCRALCPEMDAGRDWLKRHGAELHAIVF